MQLYLRHVILVFLIVMGLAPVIAQITINRPKVLEQVQAYVESQKIRELEREQTLIENRLHHLIDVLRMTTLLPAPSAVLGYPQAGFPNTGPEQAGERFAAVMRDWFVGMPAVWNLRIVNLNGIERLRLRRGTDGSLQPAILDLETKRQQSYMVSDDAGFHITDIAPNGDFGESWRPRALTLQVSLPLHHRSMTVGFVVFTIGALDLFEGYDNFAWYGADGHLIKVAKGAEDPVEVSPKGLAAILKGGHAALLQPESPGSRVGTQAGTGQGWLPVALNSNGGTDAGVRLWIVVPMAVDLIESWVGAFNNNTIILFCVILVVVFIIATLITLLIERFIRHLLSSVKAILDERDVEIRFGPFGEMIKLADGLSELARQHHRDADARAEAETQLTASRNRIQLLLNSASESIVGVDRDGRITFCNPAALKLLGNPKEGELCGKRFSGLLARDRAGGSPVDATTSLTSSTSSLASSLAPALVGRDLKNHIHLPEVAIERFDNRRLAVEFWSHPIVREGEDEVEGAVFTLVDITVRKQVQEELCRLRVLLSNIVDSMPSALIGVDADMQVTQWNYAAEQMFAIPADKAMGLRIDRACHQLSAEVESIRTALQEARIEHSVKVPMAVNGSERFVDMTAYPLVRKGTANGKEVAGQVGGAVVMVDDVTERLRMEDMMVQSEKMLSVGGLAAGMAHEINNPLAGILQNIQVLRNRLQPKLAANQRVAQELGLDMDRIEAYATKRGLFTMMDSVITSGRRAAKVVENMLSFSRKSDSSYAPQDLAELLDQAVDLAGNDYDLKKKYDFRQVEMVRDYAPDLPMVACEKGQIQQVILNLLRNGCQAMCAQPDADRPQRIILRLERVGEQVCIQVGDNGPGMDEEVAKRVFEPFFTTKAVGVGTGLGLSVSYFIITENHAGSMSVESSPGNGTCFTLCLPIRKPARPATLSV